MSDESGLGLVELIVSVMLIGLIVAAVLSTLSTMLSNDRRQQVGVVLQEDVRFATTQLVRDLRNANPVVAPASSATAPSVVEVRVGPASGPQQRVRWRLDGTTLVREQLDGGGSVTASRPALTGVTPGAGPLFTYLDEDGVVIDPSVTSPATLVACAAVVRASWTVTPEVGPAEPVSVDAEVRNRSPQGCP